jgi:hypothetical protein
MRYSMKQQGKPLTGFKKSPVYQNLPRMELANIPPVSKTPDPNPESLRPFTARIIPQHNALQQILHNKPSGYVEACNCRDRGSSELA